MSEDMYSHRPLAWLSTEPDRRRGSKTTLRNEAGELKKSLQVFKWNCSLDCFTSPLKQKLVAATSYCGSWALWWSVTPGGGGNCDFTPRGCHKRLTVACRGLQCHSCSQRVRAINTGIERSPICKIQHQRSFPSSLSLSHCRQPVSTDVSSSLINPARPW